MQHGGRTPAAALAEVTESGYHTIARMSCFHDPIAACADVEGMGLEEHRRLYLLRRQQRQTGWIPAKPAARQYLCTLAAELAQQGFDEILLTDVGYPTVGKLDKIDFSNAMTAGNTAEAGRQAQIEGFLREVRGCTAEECDRFHWSRLRGPVLAGTERATPWAGTQRLSAAGGPHLCGDHRGGGLCIGDCCQGGVRCLRLCCRS
ncbi:MAG: putative glycoside hydrolase [Dysosmobacter sp.]